MKKLLLAAILLSSVNAKTLPVTELKGDDGGRVDGKAWSSAEIKDKVYVLFYVDPDEKDTNEHVGNALKKRNFDRTHYGSIAIINMAATWLPNFAIASSLEKKQKKYPNTIYVKDLNKKLQKSWGLKDDASNVLLFNKQGELIFNEHGKLSNDKVKSLLALIEENMKK
jgi:predicted transcriptional regulator